MERICLVYACMRFAICQSYELGHKSHISAAKVASTIDVPGMIVIKMSV